MPQKTPQITTKRLLLRSLEMSDGPQIKNLAGDKAIADMTLNIPHPYEEGVAEKWIEWYQEKFEAGESLTCAIVLKSTQKLIGVIELKIEKKFNNAELGYWVTKEYWNKGYCTEAAEAMLKYGFETLNLHRIYASYFSRNPASGKVMEKLI